MVERGFLRGGGEEESPCMSNLGGPNRLLQNCPKGEIGWYVSLGEF